jgi:2-oxoisovalerate dehydrogenase E2 component (dihydrolipoyl transacylase)
VENDPSESGTPLSEEETEEPQSNSTHVVGTSQNPDHIRPEISPVDLSSLTKIKASPAVRFMLKQHQLDANDINGTGIDEWILKKDVLRHLSTIENSFNDTNSSSVDLAVGGTTTQDQYIPLTPIQAQMGKVMAQSLNIPHFLYTHSVDIGALNSLRARFNSTRTDISTPKLTALPIIMKALSQAFKEFPLLNSHFPTEPAYTNRQLLLKGSHDFGIAIDTPKGLLVPVVRNIQDHSIISLAAEIERLTNLGKEGKLSPKDLTGATFTVSNIGSIGGDVVGRNHSYRPSS